MQISITTEDLQQLWFDIQHPPRASYCIAAVKVRFACMTHRVSGADDRFREWTKSSSQETVVGSIHFGCRGTRCPSAVNQEARRADGRGAPGAGIGRPSPEAQTSLES
jgi:hypothetical protein